MENSTHQAEKTDIAFLCPAAEQLAMDEGPERGLAALTELAKSYPQHPAPPKSLAKFYAWLAKGMKNADGPFERSNMQIAVEHAKCAVALENPPVLETLEMLSNMMHLMAEHEERASYFSALAESHPDPAISFKAFGWASTAFLCRGWELAAEGRDKEANAAYHDAVTMHRRALHAWPEVPVAEKLSSYFGSGHINTVPAYVACGLADEWLREIEELLDLPEGLALAGELRAHFLTLASEMAVNAGISQHGIKLAERSLRAIEGGQSACHYHRETIRALGSLLIAHHAAGDGRACEAVAGSIERMLRQWEEEADEDLHLSPENRLPAAYNLAARTFNLGRGLGTGHPCCPARRRTLGFRPQLLVPRHLALGRSPGSRRRLKRLAQCRA